MYPWMYLDSVGLITVGYGTMLPDLGAATSITFAHVKGGAPASAVEIMAAHNLLHASSEAQKAAPPAKKYSAKHYEKVTDLRITLATASQLLDKHVDADYLQLQVIYPRFDSYPDNAKVVLFDMIYNLGAGHQKTRHHRAAGLRAFGLMNAAISRSDWATAAKYCLRHGIPPDRNKETASLFNSCVATNVRKPR